MKRIEAIVRPGKVGDVCAALELAGHHGVMITEIEGHGNQKGIEQKVHGQSMSNLSINRLVQNAKHLTTRLIVIGGKQNKEVMQ